MGAGPVLARVADRVNTSSVGLGALAAPSARDETLETRTAAEVEPAVGEYVLEFSGSGEIARLKYARTHSKLNANMFNLASRNRIKHMQARKKLK